MTSSQKQNHYQHSALVIEPHDSLVLAQKPAVPYSFVSEQNFQLTTVASIELALSYLVDQTPDIVFLSASFSPHKTLQFLEALKNHSTKKLIPLVLVVDLSRPSSIIPGTNWGGDLGIIHSATTAKEFQTTLKRFCE